MVRIGRTARIATTLFAAALLAPVLGLVARDETALAKFHNRILAPWPAAAAFANPPEGFRQTRAWLADRAWPVASAVGLLKRILYFALATPPAQKMTIGLDGHLFLNSWNDIEPGILLDSLCVRAHGDAARAGLTRALAQLAAYSQREQTPVDLVIVPTTATLYARFLPTSVPRRFRDACNAVATGTSGLRQIAAPAFLYPFDLFEAQAADPAFYPRNNWHAAGKSLAVLRDAWLAAAGLAATVDEHVDATQAPAEVLLMSGVTDPQPVYVVSNAHVRADPALDAAFRGAIGDLFANPAYLTYVYANDRPPIDQTLLIVSDSFGQLASGVFAGAFASVMQVNTNDMRFDAIAELIARARAVHRVDRILFLFQEGGVDRPINYASLLQRTAPR